MKDPETNWDSGSDKVFCWAVVIIGIVLLVITVVYE